MQADGRGRGRSGQGDTRTEVRAPGPARRRHPRWTRSTRGWLRRSKIPRPSTPLPLIVAGSAGSGKRALPLEKLKTIAGQGLYLTHSSFLVESSGNLYFANRYENSGQEVDFLSLRELIETIEVPAGREATWTNFRLSFRPLRWRIDGRRVET